MAPTILIHGEALCNFSESILRAVDVAERKARLVATSLVAANLRGVDSHGVQLLPYYVDQLEAGDMSTTADGRVVSETGCCLVYDGENGIGQPIAETCCAHGVRIAKQQGLSMVVARESNHFGAAAFWAQKYSREGLIGIVMCNASPMVPPWQGRETRFGTNPICMAVPGDRWLLDMATTTVALGKIYKARINGQETIPPGWAMDAEGVPTTSVATALSGLISPLGGYKGSGLAVLVEILVAVLGGGAMSSELGRIRVRGKPVRCSQTFLGIDVERFMTIEEFTARMERLAGLVKSTAPAKGYDEVLLAGEPEWRVEKDRRATGIPLEEGTWKLLGDTATRLGLSLPATIADPAR
jgi:LDH2 family malate/lactate/ureidoglycolate dehydrogenase